ncbi:uncharacterized protein HMPREF1541_02933 [Cyphellophora europaea CBS 101466]|uniref:Cytochrome P450 oxidoreductase n=1 Tax=Cyphellophora europaea (strain CBS 101466) TaxID=1220924 RepID=W2RWX7_CYPE1|nr:uncharacterized protein HMPREF1541_02933 [Cyphellophora europaea CBS 101466]ETN41001.1 hypothetical protein HMPREF1541_02933 [Cyphellophora europaea CBS 101466]
MEYVAPVSTQPWGAACLILALAIFSFVLYRAYFHPLARIPGPPSARFSGSWRNARYWRGTWHEDILELHRKYGRVVRIGPNEVAVVDGTTAKRLYGPGTTSVKARWYSTWDPPFASASFAERDKQHHAFLRKRASAAYAMSSILKYEPYMQESLDEVLQKFKKYAGKQIDLAEWINAFAYDVVGQLGFGEAFGHVKGETDVMDLRKTIFEGANLQACMGYFVVGFGEHYWGQMRVFTNGVTAMLLKLVGAPIPLAKFDSWGTKRIKARMASADSDEWVRDDMLSHFSRMKKADGSHAEFEEVLVEALQLVGAGADTVSTAMRTCVLAICKHAEVYARLQKEIDDFYVANNLSGGISYRETQSLPYLVAVCKEAMRLFPSIVFQLPRYAPDGGLYIDGKHIPAGYEVGISPLAQNHDTAIWGEDAGEFKPERWLESEERSRYLSSFDLTFGGHGPRMCVGRNIALVEVHKFIAQLFHHFDVQVCDMERPWRIKSFWFAYQHDFQCVLTPRERFAL